MYCTRTVQFLVSFFSMKIPIRCCSISILFSSRLCEFLVTSRCCLILYLQSSCPTALPACLLLWMYVYICIVFEIMILRSGETGIGENAFVQF